MARSHRTIGGVLTGLPASPRSAHVRRAGAALTGLVVLGALLPSCTVGPDYAKPSVPTPPAYKETDDWKPSEPRAAASGMPWWSIYDDPVLDQLERQIDVANQTLKQAEAAFRQAEAIVEEARTQYFPTLGATASGQRTGEGPGAGRSTVTNGSFARSGFVTNQFQAAATASWTPDFWGRIRRTVESNVATAQADAADIAAARLAAQSTLATDYLQLRVADELKRILDDATAAFRRSLEITQNKKAAGTAALTDVMTAQAQLEATEAQAIGVGVQRAAFEHAIAVLTGKPPSEFSIAPIPFKSTIPVVPAGVPSTLLERRPDIAAAERQVQAANAQIGVAISAYYPNITLSASYGFASSAIQNLLSASNAVWSFGPSLAETVIDFGLREAQVNAARAAHDQTVASYRQVVLTGFQQVEDELAALRILEKQAAAEAITVRDAKEAVRLTINQYRAGTVDYTAVVTAQTIWLTDEQNELTITQNRLVASVALIEALGGGWDAKLLPSPDDIGRDLTTRERAAEEKDQ
jgi:NodT family efflux transporter outer membrane factor (OMF) lipoprotein